MVCMCVYVRVCVYVYVCVCVCVREREYVCGTIICRRSRNIAYLYFDLSNDTG